MYVRAYPPRATNGTPRPGVLVSSNLDGDRGTVKSRGLPPNDQELDAKGTEMFSNSHEARFAGFVDPAHSVCASPHPVVP